MDVHKNKYKVYFHMQWDPEPPITHEHEIKLCMWYDLTYKGHNGYKFHDINIDMFDTFMHNCIPDIVELFSTRIRYNKIRRIC